MGQSRPVPGSGNPEPGIRSYIVLGRRYKYWIASIVLLTLAVSIARMMMTPATYMAQATILPSGGPAQGGVLNLIASMTGGPPLIGGSEESSSRLFPRILESRQLSLEVINSNYKYLENGSEIELTLFEFLQAETTDQALVGLEMMRAIDIDKENGIITISVQTPFPDLSAQIVNRMVRALEDFNRDVRQLSASQNSEFIHQRLEQTQGELASAEGMLTEFKRQNVRVNAPNLQLELMRLEREVALKSQIYVTLSNQAELARVEEAKNLPIVRVLDPAAVPTEPVPVPRIAVLIGGAIAGLVLATLLVAFVEGLRYLRYEAARV